MAAKMHFDLGAQAVILPQLSRGVEAITSFHFESLEKFEGYLAELKQAPYGTPMLILLPMAERYVVRIVTSIIKIVCWPQLISSDAPGL